LNHIIYFFSFLTVIIPLRSARSRCLNNEPNKSTMTMSLTPTSQSPATRSILFDRVMASGTAMAALGGVGVIATAPEASAAVVYSGVVNINVPATVYGLYLNVVTGATSTVSGGSLPGWDINPWNSSGIGFFNASPAGSHGVLKLGTAVFNPLGTMVDSSGSYGSVTTTVGGAQATLNSSVNYIGFRFLNEATSAIHYGWAQFSFGPAVNNRSLIGYGYESTPGAGILIGATGVSAVPEPSSSLGVLALIGSGLLIRRRKAA
jgi:hypothetical protein